MRSRISIVGTEPRPAQPWLAATALIHSNIVTLKKDKLHSWTALLSIFTFIMSLLGTFLVRSGVLNSVHAFANDPYRGVYILSTILFITFFSLAIFIIKSPKKSSYGEYSFLQKDNFIGLLGSASTKIWSTDRTGEIVISLEMASASDVLGGVEGITPTASATYEINSLYLTCEALSFSDDTYYSSIGDKDLRIAFNDYIYTSFAETTKKTGINCTTYISAGSIAHLVGTCRLPPEGIPKKMVAVNMSGVGTTAINRAKYLSDPVANEGEGDAFFSTVNLQRNMAHIESSQFSINNKQHNYGSFNKYEVFQKSRSI